MISSIRGYNSYSYYNQYNSYRNYNNYGFSSSLFGSNALTGTSSSFSVSDYSIIRSGAYKKLMKAYYSQDKSSNVKSLVKDKEPASVLTAQDAASMGNSIKDVMKASLWEKKSITEKDESGNETVKLDYDREAIGKALQKFTEDYNKTVDAAGNSNSMSVLRNGAYLTKSTAVNSKLLSKAGITVGLDNKLSFDQDKLNEADIASVKSLFTGYGSYASQLLNRSNAIASAAAPSSYNRNGSYSYLNNLNSSFSVLM